MFVGFSVQAEGNLDHDGNINIKQDRISQDKEEGIKKDSKHYQENELEKRIPGLFKEQTRKTIQENQKKLEKEKEDLKKSLFISEVEANKTLNETKVSLFNENYEVPVIAAEEGEQNKKIGPTLLASLSAIVLFICGGIYAVAKNMMS
jgi:type VII secretion protein EssA